LRHIGAIAIGLSLAAVACGTADPPPTSQADCERGRKCQEFGQCTYDRRGKQCVVGSDADCARSKICNKSNRCRKVGETCGAE
jgi:hypothetical protein